MKIQHPVFPEVVRDIPEADAERWQLAGWCAVGDDTEPDPVEDEIDACPTCGAVDDDPCTTFTGNPTTRHFAR